MVNRNLFIYLTHEAGHTLAEAADVMGMAPSQLSRRLSGEIHFKDNEMEAWMLWIGCVNPGPVFFPRLPCNPTYPCEVLK